jgi:ATP synthase F1 delta subunit
MEKHIALSLANNYAKALFNVAQIHNCQDAVQEQLNELCVFFCNNLRNLDKTAHLIKEKIKESSAINKYVKNFICLLINNRRTKLLNDILAFYTNMLYKRKNLQRINVFFASETNEQIKNEIAHNLKQIIGHKIIIHFSIYPAMIGGLIIDIENLRIDASYKNIMNKIHSYKAQMANLIRPQLIAK